MLTTGSGLPADGSHYESCRLGNQKYTSVKLGPDYNGQSIHLGTTGCTKERFYIFTERTNNVKMDFDFTSLININIVNVALQNCRFCLVFRFSINRYWRKRDVSWQTRWQLPEVGCR